ncbi:MAG: class B sortase [Defluviitaleaceae bacterium]|nr:class B sortase [Defluviitaleaceae bacterium]
MSKDGTDKAASTENRFVSAGFAAVVVIALIVFAASLMVFYTQVFDLRDARREHSFLLRLSGSARAAAGFADDEARSLSDFDIQMRRINPHYIAWLTVGGTAIDYPVVRGSDNIRYLDTSFFGEHNTFGTLFMDYRNKGDFVPQIIIYGHHTRHGNKFSDLHLFLDESFKQENNTITLLVNDRVVEYEIFAARLTDIHDYAYFLHFSFQGAFEAFVYRNNAPPGAQQIITLSTCVTRGDDDERVIVQGVLR